MASARRSNRFTSQKASTLAGKNPAPPQRWELLKGIPPKKKPELGAEMLLQGKQRLLSGPSSARAGVLCVCVVARQNGAAPWTDRRRDGEATTKIANVDVGTTSYHR